jgi:hypothetical protein
VPHPLWLHHKGWVIRATRESLSLRATPKPVISTETAHRLREPRSGEIFAFAFIVAFVLLFSCHPSPKGGGSAFAFVLFIQTLVILSGVVRAVANNAVEGPAFVFVYYPKTPFSGNSAYSRLKAHA